MQLVVGRETFRSRTLCVRSLGSQIGGTLSVTLCDGTSKQNKILMA